MLMYCYYSHREQLSDVCGRKKMVVIIMIIYITGICVGGFANNIFFLLVARVIQGMGVSLFPIACLQIFITQNTCL